MEEATESTLITLSQVKEGKRILLKVKDEAKGAKQVCYLIGGARPLREIMVHYTKRIGVALYSKRFLYKGSNINPNSTAADMEMNDEDTIDVIPWADCEETGAIKLTVSSQPKEFEKKSVLTADMSISEVLDVIAWTSVVIKGETEFNVIHLSDCDTGKDLLLMVRDSRKADQQFHVIGQQAELEYVMLCRGNRQRKIRLSWSIYIPK